jgi:hypothetical protein
MPSKVPATMKTPLRADRTKYDGPPVVSTAHPASLQAHPHQDDDRHITDTHLIQRVVESILCRDVGSAKR